MRREELEQEAIRAWDERHKRLLRMTRWCMYTAWFIWGMGVGSVLAKISMGAI